MLRRLDNPYPEGSARWNIFETLEDLVEDGVVERDDSGFESGYLLAKEVGKHRETSDIKIDFETARIIQNRGDDVIPTWKRGTKKGWSALIRLFEGGGWKRELYKTESVFGSRPEALKVARKLIAWVRSLDLEAIRKDNEECQKP